MCIFLSSLKRLCYIDIVVTEHCNFKKAKVILLLGIKDFVSGDRATPHR